MPTTKPIRVSEPECTKKQVPSVCEQTDTIAEADAILRDVGGEINGGTR